MGFRVYLPVAVATFIGASMGSDIIAQTSIAGESPGHALTDHLHWATVQPVGTILLLAPFVAVAFICAMVERQARTRSAAAIFVAGMLTLLYLYFDGYEGAQHALLDEKWTAAALSVGMLPFLAIPLLLLIAGAGALAITFDRRVSD